MSSNNKKFNEEDLRKLMKTTGQFLDETFNHFNFNHLNFDNFNFRNMFGQHSAIPVKTKEANGYIEIEAMVAGYSKEEVKVDVLENKIHIIARKKKDQSKIERILHFPFKLKRNHVKAKFHNGLLELSVQKNSAKPYTIEIDD